MWQKIIPFLALGFNDLLLLKNNQLILDEKGTGLWEKQLSQFLRMPLLSILFLILLN